MRLIQSIQTSALCLLLITAVAPAATAGDKGRASGQAAPLDKKTEDRARYVIKIAGCNDCHTSGYAEAAGKIPEKNWFKGDGMARAMGYDLREQYTALYAESLRSPVDPGFTVG